MYNAQMNDDEKTLEQEKQMIDRHFANDYGGKCDYNMIHYFSGEVRAIRYREIKGV